MLGGHRRRFGWLTAALAAPFIWLRVPPTAITILALAPALAAAYLVSQRLWIGGLAVGVLASLLDLADGAVARRTGRVTAFGGFLDSVLDRVVDLAFLFGLGFAMDSREGWLVVALASAGAYGTSYARARLHEAVPAPPVAWNQLMERPERLILLAAGVAAQAVAERLDAGWTAPGGQPWVLWATLIMAAGALLTMAQRILLARRVLNEAPASGPGGRVP